MSDDQHALVSIESLGGELITAEQDLLNELSSGGGYLPYVQLFTSNSDAVKEGKIMMGHYGLVRDGEITDLGDDTTFVLFVGRPRAFEKDGKEITVVYDKADPEYQRIQAAQAGGVQGCMAGPELLIWIPSENTFATFFCGSKTLKREARQFGPYMGGKACQMRSKLINNGKHKWHGPVIGPCSEQPTSLPSPEDSEDQIHRFKNPPKPKTKGEAVDGGEQEDVDR